MRDIQHFGVERFPRGIIKVRAADHREEVFLYLVPGNEKTAVIDTGLGGGDLHALVTMLSHAPPVVLQTHLHWDHIGASEQFDDVRAHAAEVYLERAGWPWQPPDAPTPGGQRVEPPAAATFLRAETLRDGDIVDLGSRALEVVHTPGHSPGSVSFLDREARALFCGDLCYLSQMLLFVCDSDLGDFRGSLRRVARLSGDVDAVFPAHGPAPLTSDDILAIHEAYEQVWRGEHPGRESVYAGNPVSAHEFDRFAFLLPPR